MLRDLEMSGQYKSKAGEKASECRRRMSRSRCRTCSWQEEGETRSRSRSRNGSKAGDRSRSKNSKQRNEMELMPCLRHKSLNKQMREKISPDRSRSGSRSRNRCGTKADRQRHKISREHKEYKMTTVPNRLKLRSFCNQMQKQEQHLCKQE